MKKRIISIILTLALVLALLSVSAAATDGIDTSGWTLLTGSTEGMTVGVSGTTGYYRIQSNTSFTNSTVGGSGLSIADGATVYLYIPENVTLTCTGADGENAVGGGAGIELPENATLYLLGEGTLNALGGSAGNGGDGADGTEGTAVKINGDISGGLWTNGHLETGVGGDGGAGGGGAGAGIGTAGAAGPDGGVGGASISSDPLLDKGTADSSCLTPGAGDGTPGSDGGASRSADVMGTLYQAPSLTLHAVGGSGGSGGAGGSASPTHRVISNMHSHTLHFTIGSSGGGGGGGGGYAAANIGQGGASGAGGGGGGGGSYASLGGQNSTIYDGNDANFGNAGGGAGGIGGESGVDGGGTQTTSAGHFGTAATGGIGGVSGEAGENGAPKGYDYRSFYRTDNIAENNGTTFNVLATAATGSSGGYADITYYVTIEWSADAAGIEFENGALYEWSVEELKYVPVEGAIIQLLGESVCLNMTITVTNRSNAAAKYAVSYSDNADSLTTVEAKKEDSENDASGTLASADQNGAAAAAPGSGHAYAITAELIDAGENVAPSAVYTGVISVTEVTDDTIFEEGTDLTLGVYTVTICGATETNNGY